MRKSKYADLYTLRSDGRYQGYYRDAEGRRHAICDRDPEQLYRKILDKESQPAPVITFRAVAGSWEAQHREEIETRTWKNYKPHYEQLLDEYGDIPFGQVEAADIAADLARAKARGLSASVVNARRSIWRGIFDHAVIQGVAKYSRRDCTEGSGRRPPMSRCRSSWAAWMRLLGSLPSCFSAPASANRRRWRLAGPTWISKRT